MHVARLATSIVVLSAVIVTQPAVATVRSARGATARAADTPNVTDLGGAVERLGRDSYSSIYAGVSYVDPTDTAVNVYLTSPDAAAESAFRDLGPSGAVNFLSATYTQANLAQQQSQLKADWDSLEAQGIHVVEFWPDVITNRLQIGVENETPSDAATLEAEFGGDLVRVFDVTPDQVPTLTADRGHDTSPWNAGDAIHDPDYGCSTGFGVAIGSQTRVLGAAHCWPAGSSLKNAACINSDPCSPTSGSNDSMGTAVSVDTTYGDLDTALWTTGGSDLVWLGPIGTASLADLAGTYANVHNLSICNSGAYSGEVCDIVVQYTGGCLEAVDDYGNSVKYCRLTFATSDDNGIANETGDSGGPIYHVQAGGGAESYYAVGTDTAEDTDMADVVPCTYYTNETCSDDIYYTEIGPILTHWGASLNTG